jgi:hypothetical protein
MGPHNKELIYEVEITWAIFEREKKGEKKIGVQQYHQ